MCAWKDLQFQNCGIFNKNLRCGSGACTHFSLCISTTCSTYMYINLLISYAPGHSHVQCVDIFTCAYYSMGACISLGVYMYM